MFSSLFGAKKLKKHSPKTRENEITVAGQPDLPAKIDDLDEVELEEMDEGCQEASTPLRPKKPTGKEEAGKALGTCSVS